MAWIYLLFAGLLEIVWAFSMKQSEGFTRLTPSVLIFVFYAASFALNSCARRMSLACFFVFNCGWSTAMRVSSCALGIRRNEPVTTVFSGTD